VPLRFRRQPGQRHIEVLARTAQLEMSMGVGSYQDTLAEMHTLINRLEDARKAHRQAEDVLIDQLRKHCLHLESVIHRREQEFDRIEDRLSALIEEHAKCPRN
jgi:predicted nuclease with TOPRIM domain